MDKNQVRIWDEHPGSYFREHRNNFWGSNTSILRCGSGNLFDSGSGMEKNRIRDKHPGFATLAEGIPTTNENGF